MICVSINVQSTDQSKWRVKVIISKEKDNKKSHFGWTLEVIERIKKGTKIKVKGLGNDFKTWNDPIVVKRCLMMSGWRQWVTQSQSSNLGVSVWVRPKKVVSESGSVQRNESGRARVGIVCTHTLSLKDDTHSDKKRVLTCPGHEWAVDQMVNSLNRFKTIKEAIKSDRILINIFLLHAFPRTFACPFPTR